MTHQTEMMIQHLMHDHAYSLPDAIKHILECDDEVTTRKTKAQQERDEIAKRNAAIEAMKTPRQKRDEYIISCLKSVAKWKPDSKNPNIWEEMKIAIRDSTPEELQQKVKTKIDFYGHRKKFQEALLKFYDRDALVAKPDIFNMIRSTIDDIESKPGKVTPCQ